MRRRWLLAGLTLVLVTGLSYVHPFGRVRSERPAMPGTLLREARMPPEAKAVLIAKCADCHSSETRWPVYARIAPGSWLIERDIMDARRHMDLSHWELQTEDEKQVMSGKISHEAKSGDMPPLQYLALHWGASLTPAEVRTLSNLSKPTGSVEASTATEGDAARGKILFNKRCTGCHSMELNGEGPKLAGVYGRRAGSVTGFEYSDGLKSSGLTWDNASLEKWLSGPDQVVADARMDFYVAKPAERRDLIAYLKQSSPMNSAVGQK